VLGAKRLSSELLVSVRVFVLFATVADGFSSTNSAAQGVTQPASISFLTSTSPVPAPSSRAFWKTGET